MGKTTSGEGNLECEDEKDEVKGSSEMQPRVLWLTQKRWVETWETGI